MQYMNKIKLVWTYTAIAISLYAIWVFRSDIKNLETIEKFNPYLILAGVFFAFLNYFLRAYRWHWLLNKSGEKINISKSFLSFFSGFFYTFTPGKIGEISKSLHLYELTKIPARKSMPIIWIERTSDVAGVAILSFPIIIYLLTNDSKYFYESSVLITFASWIFGLLAAVSLFFIGKIVGTKIITKSNSIESKEMFVETFSKTLNLLKENLFKLVAWGWFAWVLEGITCLLCLKAIGAEIPFEFIENMSASIRFYSSSMLAGALSFIPGGLGATEVTLTKLFIAAGLQEGIAASGTFLTRVATLWVGFPIGIIAIIKINKKKGEP